MQVAFTSHGLAALGAGRDVLAGFSAEFVAGMSAEASRSRRLGDTGENAPDRWDWGRPGREPHVLLMLFANPGKLAGWKSTVENERFRAAFDIELCLPTADLDEHEPFGFRDGVSQPRIDWENGALPHDDTVYSNLCARGEFLLGYANEYGKYTQRPLLAPTHKGADKLPAAQDRPDTRDLGRNGTYLVFRQLEQDVRGFWRFLDAAARSDPSVRMRLAEAMVGRSIDGCPIVLDRQAAGSPEQLNSFTYDSDPDGLRCPLGAHIRRANPRNADLPGGPGGLLSRGLRLLGLGDKSFRFDRIASTRFHRVIRHGREYGPGLSIEQALQSDHYDDATRGIHFLCLNANIQRQFEFVQNAWLMTTKFDGLTGESDPLLGNRNPKREGLQNCNFSLPRDNAPPEVLTGLGQFITVRGGAYFFLPGVRALRFFAT
jgi:deferrochelatase/peroxidase EfeB